MKQAPDFWVGDRVVRPSLGEIRLGIERVHLEPRSMEVLLALSRRAPQVASKQDLIDEVWGEKFVSDEVLTHAIWDLRRALGDNAANPEFIQTIPKRGYRLIAPVKELQPAGRRRTAPDRSYLSWHARVVTLGVVALLVAAAIWMGRATSSSQPPVLTLVPASPSAYPSEEFPEWTENLEGHLLTELSGMPGVDVRSGESCRAPSGMAASYCLQPVLSTRTDGFWVSAQLKAADSLNLVYATPYVDLSSRSDLAAAARETAARVRTCFEVLQKWNVEDPDIRPWISLQDHDIRAIRDFLVGVEHVYRNETGGGPPLKNAIAIDPQFVAPRVWRTTTVIFADAQVQADHRAALEDLYRGADAFEKAMIRWAMALMDDEPSEQIRQLRMALRHEPRNRPLRMVLALAFLALDDIDQAWFSLTPLLAESWCFPGLYPVAAQVALTRSEVRDARNVLEQALECEPVDPEALALLRLLAVYEGNSGNERRYGSWFEKRKREMLPEKLEIDLEPAATSLAARAQSEGKAEIADRLRAIAN